jgi:hypothetical protein
MHWIYGALRLLALVFDAYVFYHAKNLKIMDEEEETNEGDEKKMDTDNRKPHHQHKRSASREIRLLLANLDEENSEKKHSGDFVANEISAVTSNGLL